MQKELKTTKKILERKSTSKYFFENQSSKEFFAEGFATYFDFVSKKIMDFNFKMQFRLFSLMLIKIKRNEEQTFADWNPG